MSSLSNSYNILNQLIIDKTGDGSSLDRIAKSFTNKFLRNLEKDVEHERKIEVKKHKKLKESKESKEPKEEEPKEPKDVEDVEELLSNVDVDKNLEKSLRDIEAMTEEAVRQDELEVEMSNFKVEGNIELTTHLDTFMSLEKEDIQEIMRDDMEDFGEEDTQATEED